MENAPTQPHTEKTHQMVRFTAIAENLHASLVNLTDEVHQGDLSSFLYAFSTKPITVDRSDTIDGVSQSARLAAQYSHGLEYIQNPNIRFRAEPKIVRPRLAPVVDTIGFRLLLNSTALEKIVAPPLYGPEMRKYGVIPLRYTIPHPGDNIEERIRIVEAVLGEGTYFDEVVLVSPADPEKPFFTRVVPNRDPEAVEALKAKYVFDPRGISAEVTNLADYRESHTSGPASA